MLEEVTRFLPQWHSPKDSSASAHTPYPIFESQFIASPRQGDGANFVTSLFRREIQNAKSWYLLQGCQDTCLDVRYLMRHPWVKNGKPLGSVPDWTWSGLCVACHMGARGLEKQAISNTCPLRLPPAGPRPMLYPFNP